MCYISAKKILQKDFYSRSSVVMEQINEKIDDYMDELETKVNLVANNNIIYNNLKYDNYDLRILPIIQNLTAMDRFIINSEIYSEDFALVYRANNVVTIAPEVDIRNLLSKNKNFGDSYQTLIVKNDKNGLSLSIVRNILQNDKLLGKIVLYIDYNQLLELVGEAESYIEEGNICIVDSSGKILSASTGKMLNKDYLSVNTDFKGKSIEGFNNNKIYWLNAENINLRIFTFVSPTYVLKQLDSIVCSNILISLVVFILSVFSAIILGKSISEPIEDMKRYIEENMSDK